MDELDFLSISNLIFAEIDLSRIDGAQTQAVKVKFEVDKKSNSSILIFQKSSADQQGVLLPGFTFQTRDKMTQPKGIQS